MPREDSEINIKISAEGADKTAKDLDNVANSLDKLSKKDISDKITLKLGKLINALSKARNLGKKTLDVTTPKVSIPKTKLPSIKDEYAQASRELKKQAKEQDKLNKKQSKFAKIWSSFKRIAFYRTIRRAIQLVTQGLGQGLTNLREYDKELDTTLRSLSNAGTALKNSFASALGSLLKSVEPLVVRIADGIANITNRINEAKAVMSGATTYTKILTSDTEEWKQQLEDVGKTLLSFDKFESLEKQKYTGTVEAQVGMSQEEAQTITSSLTALKVVLEEIAVVLSTIVAIKIIAFIGTLSTSFQSFQLQCALANTTLQYFKVSLGLIIASIASLTMGIISLVSSWGNMGTWQKIITIFVSLAAAISAAAVAFHILKGNWIGALAIGGIVAGIGLTIGSQLSNLSANKFEDGGVPPKSELFYMNEYGKPEALINTGGTQTNVINIDQLTYGMKQGFVQAIYETGLLDAMQSTVVVEGRNIDNNAVARGLFNALKTESTRRGGNQL